MAGAGRDEDAADMESSVLPSPLDGVKMADAPILFLVLSHRAFRKELEELHRVAVEAVENGSYDRDVFDALRRRFEFFKLVYEYHCAAEDEIIFAELDMTIKNVVSEYAQEHKSIIGDLNSLLHCLDLVGKESEDLTNLFSAILSHIGSLKSIICQHMLEEERQVFPLILKQLSAKKQAKMVWKCICTVPAAVLEDFMPWIASSLPPDEQIDLLVGIKTVLPREEILQEVVISWLHNKKPSPAEACNGDGIGAQGYSGRASFGNLLEIFPEASHFGEEKLSKKPQSVHPSSRENPLNGIHILNSAIAREFRKIQVELYQLRSSATCSNLSSSLVQLQFLADILIFYSKALDQILYPMLKGLSKNGLPFPYKRIVDESQIGKLQCFLYGKLQFGSQLSNFLEGLCKEVESLVGEISNLFIYVEKESKTGLSFMYENSSYTMQLWLLYAGLKSMPFGLLRRTALWFSATFCDEEFKTTLDGVNVKCPLANKSFSQLLHGWFHSGYSGRIPLGSLIKALGEHSFRKDFCKSIQFTLDTGFSNLELEIQDLKKLNSTDIMPNSAVKDNIKIWKASSSLSKMSEKLESGGFNLDRSFPQMLSYTFAVLKHPAMHGTFNNVFTLESRPMNHLVCFHNALIRDLRHIVSLSADLSGSFQLFPDLQRRFELLQIMYDVHIDSENEAVFPALESKGKLNNITHYFTTAHQLDTEQFKKVSVIVDEICNVPDNPVTMGQTNPKYHQLCLKLHDACLRMQKVISEHIRREEIEIWPLFAEYFSIEEEEKIIGRILGRTRAENLIKMIPWLISLLKEEEWHGLISLWRKATKNTNFDEWLRDWWGDMIIYSVPTDEGRSSLPPSFAADPEEMVLTHLGEQIGNIGGLCNINGDKFSENDFADHTFEESRSLILHLQDPRSGESGYKHNALGKHSEDIDVVKGEEIFSSTDQVDKIRQDFKVSSQDEQIVLNQKELETAIRRISCDPALDSQKKSHVMQSLLMSRWVVTQKKSKTMSVACDKEEDLGQQPSYQDSLNLIFGCKHYKRNCKLLVPCCNKLFPCIRCHDDLTDHPADRRTITKMMCMKCLVIQPIGPRCSNPDCNDFSMAKYYCRICKLFDDERQIYHCPYCNLCRVGKGLGIRYIHCMQCNACMSKTLSLHVCREKCFEDNCPICHEDLFTSSSPGKALPCGHVMHSSCFQEYTFSHYTCPICSKSLGDMQVYFRMLDALLSEEQIPDEYSSKTQVILCNDCEKRGITSFHWLYHKCPHCRSYNTRLL